MQLKALIIAAVASVVVAQTATNSAVTSGSTCAAQNILDSCIGTIKGQVNACAYSDYSCLCTQYQNMLTCYNNCPNDLGVGTIQSLREQNCNAASVYGSTTTLGTAPASTASTASSTGTESSAASAASGFATGTSSRSGTGSSASATSSSSTSSSTNGAEGLTVGGVFALFAAGVAALL